MDRTVFVIMALEFLLPILLPEYTWVLPICNFDGKNTIHVSHLITPVEIWPGIILSFYFSWSLSGLLWLRDRVGIFW